MVMQMEKNDVDHGAKVMCTDGIIQAKGKKHQLPH